MKYLAALILMFSFAFGMKAEMKEWPKDLTFSDYLDAHDISKGMLDSISKKDQEYLSDIQSRYKYYELLDNDGTLMQALIPISREMQIHLFKEVESDRYKFDIIPIVYRTHEYFAKVIINSNPYVDAKKAINRDSVAKKASQALKDIINTKKLHKGDMISFVYTQRTRLGVPYTMPDIKVMKVKTKKINQFIYVDEDGHGYKETDKKVAYTVTGKKKVTYTRRVKGKGTTFGMPLRHARVTSSFSYRRWHPILHRYRPHHGTDFGARRGTPLLAVNDGTVSYAGWKGGYGRVVQIRHAGGYESFYAHQSRMRVKRGQKVKKGQIIGYVGSSGRSTGPHLHFGLKKNGRWVDPMKYLRKKSIKTSILKKFTKYENVAEIRYKKVSIKGTEENRMKLQAYLLNDTPSYIWGRTYEGEVHINDREKFEDEE
ncbi:peptidoglycan DD-metalloendopeptidase family protein [Sulfurovum riftiae]|uniref:Peptidase M24 n=1 Tax=Sulfurovum riftiae TaxID=1630136 RepID=A0A151CF83_9BACT|nr:peptidoglycan DD-metalloendopeptidase family protein [Sulfurovum riftiae]KYJ86181.1 peptidase M24 [Sulfurovum riftiae]